MYQVYPMEQKTKEKVTKLMREILFHVAEKGQVVMKPHAGELGVFDAALRVLRNAGVVEFDWNPKGQDNKMIIGAVFIILTVTGLLQVFETKFGESK